MQWVQRVGGGRSTSARPWVIGQLVRGHSWRQGAAVLGGSGAAPTVEGRQRGWAEQEQQLLGQSELWQLAVTQVASSDAG